MAGKGLPFIGKMNEFLGKVLHPTVQKIGSSRAATETMNHGYYLLQLTPFIVEAGSTDNLLKVTAHPFKVGDAIRLKTTANYIVEHEIIIDEIVDANFVKFAGYLSANLTAGDQVYGRRPTTETYATDGTSLATLSYLKDSVSVPVARDTVTPANSTALPVEIMGANGMVLNVTTGDIDVQLNHADRTVNSVTVAGDSIKIGDGTNIASIVGTALKVNGSAVTQPVSASVLPLPTGASTLAEQQTQTTSLGTINTSVNTLLKPASTLAEVTLVGTVSNITNSVTVAQATGSNLHTVVDSGSITVTQAVGTNLHTVVDSGSITANAGTNLNTSALALDATLAKLTVAQSAALGTNTGAMVMGSVTTANPSYTTGQISPLSLTIGGGLRIASSQLPTTIGQNTVAASLSVTPATSAQFLTKPAPITASFAENLTLSTVTTITAPTNATSVIIQASDANGANIRVKQGGAAASATSGIQFQPGRSEKFDCGTDLSVCSESGTNAISFQWFIQA